MARSSRWCFEKTWSLGNKSVWRWMRWGWKWFEAEFVASAKIKPKFSENLMGTWWGLDGVEKTQSSNNRQAWWKKWSPPCWQVKTRTTERFNNSEGLGAAGRVLQAKDSNVRCQRHGEGRFPGAPDSILTCRHLVCLDLAWLVLACLDFFDLTNSPWIAWLELFGLSWLTCLYFLDLTWLDVTWLDLTYWTWVTIESIANYV